MNNPIMLTPQDIIALILGICTAIITVSAALTVIGKAISKIQAPDRKQNERITVLEESVEKINRRLELGDSRFEADTKQIEALESSVRSSNKIMLESLQVLIEHSIDGNNTERLKSMKHRLDQYLLDKSVGDI